MRHAERKTTDGARALTPRGATGYRSAPMSLRRLLLAHPPAGRLGAPAAQAARQVSIMMDDDQLLYRGDVTQTRTLVTMRSLGVEAVRATVLWRVVGRGRGSHQQEIERLKSDKPRQGARAAAPRFKPTDPRTYPTRNWDRYDNLVKEATKLGMRVYFTITGPGPSYAHRIAPPSQRANAGTYRPYPSRYRASSRPSASATRAATATRTASAGAAARVAVVAVERAQPARLAVAAVGERRRPACPRRRRCTASCTTPATRASSAPATAPTRSCSARRRRWARDSAGPRNGIRPIPFLRELPASRPTARRTTAPTRPRARCEDFVQNRRR